MTALYGHDWPEAVEFDPTVADAVDGARVLNDVRDFLARFVAFPSDDALTATTLWAAHTHALEAFDCTPRIAFLSPEPGSGKTRALEILELLVLRPLLTVNVTPAYLFRKVADEAGPPTLLYDEIDTVFGPKAKDNEDIRGMLNAGYRRGATAGRCVLKGKTVDVEELPAFAAVALPGWTTCPTPSAAVPSSSGCAAAPPTSGSTPTGGDSTKQTGTTCATGSPRGPVHTGTRWPTPGPSYPTASRTATPTFGSRCSPSLTPPAVTGRTPHV
jgi:hypothetical protein